MGSNSGDEVVADIDPESVEETQEPVSQQGLVAKKVSWNKLRRYDSFDIESRRIPGLHGHASKVVSFSSSSPSSLLSHTTHADINIHTS